MGKNFHTDKYYAGSVHETKSFGLIEVVEYVRNTKIKVRFIESGYETWTDGSRIRTGSLKDLFAKTVFGVGFIGGVEYGGGTGVAGQHNKASSLWRSMLSRCYGKDRSGKNACYADITVCDEWHNFQNFAGWFYANHPDDGKLWHLDKDIKIKGNKQYSPESCLFVTPQENTEAAWAREWVAVNPDGVKVKFYNKNKFCRENNLNSTHLGEVLTGKRNHHKGWTKP